MCRLESYRATDAALDLTLSLTSYKMFMGTNMMNPHIADRFGRSALANPLGVSPALETADGYLMLGRRNARVAYYPSRVHPFSGCLEPVDGGEAARGVNESRSASAGPAAPDVFATVRRELREELSLQESDLTEIRCAGFVEDESLRQLELMFRVKCTRTRAELERQVDQSEHNASLAVPATPVGIEPYLSDPQLTPVAVAALLLWGRAALGAPWFEAAAARVTA